MAMRLMTARYPGTCVRCLQAITPGAQIYWSGSTRQAVHETCPERIPAWIRQLRWHSQPEREVRSLDTERACDRQSCGHPIRRGDRQVVISVRRRGRTSDDHLVYHEECWDEMCREDVRRETEARAAAHASVPRASSSYSPRPTTRRRGPGGAWCIRCGGPACDGSGICEMCE